MILRIVGTPVPQGSMRMFPSGGMAHSNAPALRGYRGDIQSAWDTVRGSITTGPVEMSCVFAFPRPKNHYLPANTKRPTPVLKADAPFFHIGPPDVDKLLRAVFDALTGRAYADDAQIVRAKGVKTWDEYGWTRIEITIAEAP